MTTPEEGAFTLDQKMTAKRPKEVQIHMIPYKRWDALKAQIRALGDRTFSFSSAAWAFVGIAVTAVASLLSWWPAFAAMSLELRNEFNWVWVVLVSALVLGTGVAIALFIADRKIQRGRASSVESVLAEMALLEDV